MKKNTPWVLLGGILIVLIVLTAYFLYKAKVVRVTQELVPAATTTPVLPKTITVSYQCDVGKTVIASYKEGALVVPLDVDGRPVPTGSVLLVLSDGRSLSLKQTISADGTRYANEDESIVFWSKGRGLMFLEHDRQTYTGCIELAPETSGLTEVYASSTAGFSLRLPVGFVSRVIKNGVAWAVSSTTTEGTNLSKDSYLSIEKKSSPVCEASLFLEQKVSTSTLVEGDTIYSFASTSDAGAGNRYEELVYTLPNASPCIAVRYFIHYSVFENYPTGSIREFDKQALLQQFDAIRRTLIIAQ